MKMRFIILIFIELFAVRFCISQSNINGTSNLLFDNKTKFDHLSDCQVYTSYENINDKSILETSYKFDENGNISEKLHTSTDHSPEKSIFSYTKNKLSETTHYLKFNDSIISIRKSVNYYGKNEEVINKINSEYNQVLENWDIISEYKFEYNKKNQLLIETGLSKCDGCNIYGDGTKWNYYDSLGRKIESKFYSNNNDTFSLFKDTLSNITRYEYSNTSYKVTTISSSSVFTSVYKKNISGKLIIKETNLIQGLKNLYLNGEYIANIDSLDPEYNLQSIKTLFSYDELGRLSRIVEKHSTISIIKEFHYGTTRIVHLPMSEFLNYYDSY